MTKFLVRIDLNSLSYDIEAVDEAEALEKAEELARMEGIYDLLKWADYTVEGEELHEPSR